LNYSLIWRDVNKHKWGLIRGIRQD